MWKLQYVGHLMQKADSLEKTLMLGRTEGKRRRGQQRMRWLDSFKDPIDMNLSKLHEIVKDTETWHAAVHRVTKTYWQNNNMNTGVHVSFQIIVCSRYMPRSGIAGSYGNSSFSFLRTSILFSVVAVPIFIPTNSVGGLPFLHTLSSIY